MPVDLVGAIVGWLVGVLGDSGMRLARGSPDQRALRKTLRAAIKMVAAEANSDPDSRTALERGLRLCFSSPPRLPVNPTVSVANNLKAAIAVQLSVLEEWVNSDTGRPFYDEAGVEPDWLIAKVTEAITGALRQVVAIGGLPELVHGLDAADITERLEILGSQVSALTLQPTVTVMRTLPRDIATFTGREAETKQLMQTLTDSVGPERVVSIHAIDGMPGVGKTAFAVHVAHRLVPRFPDGQLFIRLHAHTPGQRPVDPADALVILLLSNGMAPQQIPESLEARTALWRQRMADAEILLLLDDAAGHEQVRPLLPESAGCLVLITSRRRLLALDDVTSFRLDTLQPDEGARLFVRLAARPDLRLGNPAVADIVRLCGSLPLAIRLVAAQMANHPAWTITHLAAELTAAESRLTLMRAENISVTAAFDLSYERLTADQQDFFRRLGLHPGSDIDAYAAAALSGTELAAARRHLSELYDWHLIDEPVAGRYRFHDLIREHVATLATQDLPTENETALYRLLDYYQQAATLADQTLREKSTQHSQHPLGQQVLRFPDVSDFAAALAWLEAERANLAAAIGYAAAHHYTRAAVRLSHALSFFAERQGYWDQTLPVQETALTCARETAALSDQARVLNDMAALQCQKGDFTAAAAGATEALRLSRVVKDQDVQAEALRQLGVAQYLSGDLQAAITSVTKSLALYRRLRNRAGQADSVLCLGEVQSDSGEYQIAAASFEEALNLFRELGNRLGQANALTGIGIVQARSDDHEAAAASYEHALRLFQDLDDPRGQATVLIDMGGLQADTKEYAAAGVSFEKALAIFRKLGSPLGKSKALYDVGLVRRMTGDYTAAVIHFTEALEVYRDLGDQAGTADTYSQLGIAQANTGDYTEAIASFAEALALCNALNSQADAHNPGAEIGESGADSRVYSTVRYTLSARGQTYRAMGHYEKALADFNHIVDLDPQLAWAMAQRGITYHLIGQYEEALADLDRAIDLDPQLAWAIVQRGANYREMRRFDAALSDFNQVIEVDVNLAEAYGSRGLAYFMIDQYEHSLDDLNKAININPDLGWAIMGRGMTHRQMSRFMEALADLNHAARIDPESAAPPFELAMTYLRLAEPAPARAALHQAVELGAKEIAAKGATLQRIFDLALSHAALGHSEQTTALWEQALALPGVAIYIRCTALHRLRDLQALMPHNAQLDDLVQLLADLGSETRSSFSS